MRADRSGCRWRFAAVVAVALVVALCAPARAQKQVTIGLYTPTAPFRGPSERLEYISNLATHLSKAAGGRTVVGRVFARESAFAAAVRNGDIQFAVVNVPYAAASRLQHEVLGVATRNGGAAAKWMLVASGRVRGIADLFEESVAMPGIGAREKAFLAYSLLEGEVEAKWFSKVTLAPDTYSALTLVSVGRVQAAFVPSGVPLPSGTRRVMELRAVGWPMFVALPGADKRLIAGFRSELSSFSGRVFTGFTSAKSGRAAASRPIFAKRRRRAPMAVPRESRLAVKGLYSGQPPRIQMSDLAALVVAPTGSD